MRRAVVLAALLWSSRAVAQFAPQQWNADQDGQNLYQAYGVSALGVGIQSVDPNAKSEVFCNQDGACVHFIVSTSSGANATASTVWQASGSGVYGTPPYAFVAAFGTGYVGFGPSTTPFWVPGNVTFAYSGSGIQNFDSSNPSTYGWVFSARQAGIQTDVFSYTAANGFHVGSLAGTGTRCLQVSSTGIVTPAASACGSGAGTVTSVTGTGGQILCTPSSPNPVCSLINTGAGAGSCTNCSVTFDALGRETAYSSGTAPVTSVTATPPIFSSGGTTPVISEQGAIVSGSTSTTAQNLGAISTSMLACATSAGVCTVDGVTVNGGLNFNTSTATETLASFSCAAHQFVNQASTGSGLACVALGSGDVPCSALPALTGADGIASAGGTCTVTNSNKGKVLVDAADTTPDYLDAKLITDSSTLAAQINNAGANENKKIYVVGVRDGGSLSGVGHKTTTTWGNNSLMATDGSGNWTVQSTATCGQMPALTGDVTTSAGSCATTVPAWQQTINFWVIGIIPGGWLATSQSTATFGTAIEWAYKQAFTKCRVTVNLTTNSLAGCTSSTWELSKNGSPLGGSCAVVIPCGTAGVFDSGSVAVSYSTSDLVGAETILTGVASSGTVTGSMLITLQ